jgi:CBS-domain-containing membrane protein
MRDQDLGGLPVVDADRAVIGVLRERDLLARWLAPSPPGWWRQLVLTSSQLACRYRKRAGTTVADVMSDVGHVLDLDATVDDAGVLMRDDGARLLPVVAGRVLVGVVTITDMIDDLVPPVPMLPSITDAALAQEMLRRMDAELWTSRHRVHVTACEGVIGLHGCATSAVERAALRAMARAIPGCVDVADHLLTEKEIRRRAGVPAT